MQSASGSNEVTDVYVQDANLDGTADASYEAYEVGSYAVNVDEECVW